MAWPWTLDGSRAVAIIRLQGEEANPEPDPEGTFLLGAQGDILTRISNLIQTSRIFIGARAR